MINIEFPSDKITLAAIRRQHRGVFDTLEANFFDGDRLRGARTDGSREPLAEMIYIERRLAQETYEASVRGDRQSGFLGSTSEDERGFVEDLATHYERYGLAQGAHEARRLIESIESQATTQASNTIQTSDAREDFADMRPPELRGGANCGTLVPQALLVRPLIHPCKNPPDVADRTWHIAPRRS